MLCRIFHWTDAFTWLCVDTSSKVHLCIEKQIQASKRFHIRYSDSAATVLCADVSPIRWLQTNLAAINTNN